MFDNIVLTIDILGKDYNIPVSRLPLSKNDPTAGPLDIIVVHSVFDTLAVDFSEEMFALAKWLFLNIYKRHDLYEKLINEFSNKKIEAAN